mmetsp:Transcript_5301/g.15545  ORF Transcript_5301/g.15545 Transcript_5301/m.15545 type:complete len:389 (+) Transcript_5301:1866-3032(+)
MTRATTGGSGNGGGRGRINSLPTHVVDYLKAWILSPAHIHHPYPTEEEKAKIQEDTGIELKKLNNWFVNNRIRFWKPRFEAMQRKQKQQGQAQDPQDHELSSPSVSVQQSSSPSKRRNSSSSPDAAADTVSAARRLTWFSEDVDGTALPASGNITSSSTASQPSTTDDDEDAMAAATAITSSSYEKRRETEHKHRQQKERSDAHLDKVYDVLTQALDEKSTTSKSTKPISARSAASTSLTSSSGTGRTTPPRSSTPQDYSRAISDTSASTSVASSDNEGSFAITSSGQESHRPHASPSKRSASSSLTDMERSRKRRVSIGSVTTTNYHNRSPRKRFIIEYGLTTPRSQYRRKDEDLWRNACKASPRGDDINLPTLDEAALLFGLAHAT